MRTKKELLKISLITYYENTIMEIEECIKKLKKELKK